jgi:hypothetical protein
MMSCAVRGALLLFLALLASLRETFLSDAEKGRDVKFGLRELPPALAHEKSQPADGEEDDAQKAI